MVLRPLILLDFRVQLVMSVGMKVTPLAEAGRLDALYRTGLLDSPPEEPFDRLTQLVCRVLGVPVSLVSLVDADRQFFKSQRGLPEPWSQIRETPLTHSFCQHVVIRGEALVISDAASDPAVCGNLAIRDLGVSAYLGVPLTTPEGHILGSLCAIDVKPRNWTETDLLTLEDIAHAVMGEVLLRREIARRRESEEQLSLLGQELTHRIKNIFAVTSSLVALSARAGGTAETVVTVVRQQLSALAKAHDYVTPRRTGDPPLGDGSTLAGLFQVLLAAYPQNQIEIGACDQIVGAKAAQALALIFHETATNAIKYGALSTPEGRIVISCEQQVGALAISWRETGPRRLGTPEQRGFGSSMAERIARSHLGGDLEREWLPTGLVLTLRVPAEGLFEPHVQGS
jgi:two-component sensor histidine kinase